MIYTLPRVQKVVDQIKLSGYKEWYKGRFSQHINNFCFKIADSVSTGPNIIWNWHLINLAKQGYCNHFVCLSVCLSICLSVCLFSVCPESIYIHVHTTQHMEYYTEHYDVISWSIHVFLLGEAGCGEVRWGGWGEVRWGRVWPNKPILPILNHFEPLWTTLNHIEPHWTTLNHIEPLWTTLNHIEPLWTTLNHFEPLWTT